MDFHAMVDMARSPEELKKENEKYATSSPAEATGPKYPYGLCLRLDEETLAKLGIEGDLPEIGDMVHLIAMGEVTSARQEKIEVKGENKTSRCIEIQITHLKAENEDRENESENRRGAFYDDDDDEGDED